MRQMFFWGLVLTGALFTAGTSAALLDTPQTPARATAAMPASTSRGGPGARVLVDAHNAYPSDGKWADRIDRALSTGLPVAIEQDLVWYTDPATGVGRSVVSHGGSDAATEPTFEEYFFLKVKPIMEKALAGNRREDWPLIVLNLDFKTNEPAHHAAVWALLGKYEAWLTTAERTAGASADAPAPLRVGPMLVLTGGNDKQQVSFYDSVPAGQRLRLFGAIADVRASGADQKERAINYATMPVDTLIPAPVTNYRRWVNFSWAVVEAGGASYAADWTPAEADRLRALVARAHAMDLWIRFYTLNGHAKEESQGWGAPYNFGSPESVALRWKAAIDAHADFIASDQYEALARVKAEMHAQPAGKSSDGSR
jgi:hypothetical protein